MAQSSRTCGYWKLVFYCTLFLFAAADSVLVTEECVPGNHCINWLAAQGRRIIEAPGIYVYSMLHPDTFYLNESRNVVSLYVLGCNVLMFFAAALVIAALMRAIMRRFERIETVCGESGGTAGAGLALAIQSLILVVVGLFALGYAFGLAAALSGDAALSILGIDSERQGARRAAWIGRAAGVLLVIIWTLGNYFASPFQSVFFDQNQR